MSEPQEEGVAKHSAKHLWGSHSGSRPVPEPPATPSSRGWGWEGVGWVPITLPKPVGEPGQSLHPPGTLCHQSPILTAGPGGPTGPGGPEVPSLPGKPIKPWQGNTSEQAETTSRSQ